MKSIEHTQVGNDASHPVDQHRAGIKVLYLYRAAPIHRLRSVIINLSTIASRLMSSCQLLRNKG